MLDNWMRELTFHGPFSIPWQASDLSNLASGRPGCGTLFSSTHLPHFEMLLPVLAAAGRPIDLVVADPGKIVDGDQFLMMGRKERVKAISANQGALLKVRTALAQGKSVVCLADSEIFGTLSPQALQVAALVNASVNFWWAKRQADGTICMTVQAAPYPQCETDEQIDENLAFLRMMNKKTLAELGVSSD